MWRFRDIQWKKVFARCAPGRQGLLVRDCLEQPIAAPPWRQSRTARLHRLCRQDYANFCLTACIIVAAAVVSTVANPHIVPYVLWDARISYPASACCWRGSLAGRVCSRARLECCVPTTCCLRCAAPGHPPTHLPTRLCHAQLNSEVDTIPAWAAVFAPLMMLLLTVRRALGPCRTPACEARAAWASAGLSKHTAASMCLP